MRDSNPRKRSQSPVCYRYTNPLNCAVLYSVYYYTHIGGKVKCFFLLFSFFFLSRQEETFGSIAWKAFVYTGKGKNFIIFPLPVSVKKQVIDVLFHIFSLEKLPSQLAIFLGKTAQPFHDFAFSGLTGKGTVNQVTQNAFCYFVGYDIIFLPQIV